MLKTSSIFFRERSPIEPYYWSWCTWTTFGRLQHSAGYWSAPLPLEEEILENATLDGGMWSQPFRYSEIAHIIIPRQFSYEKLNENEITWIDCSQDIDGLSKELNKIDIDYSIGEICLEVKLF
jgi:hypothetical protein